MTRTPARHSDDGIALMTVVLISTVAMILGSIAIGLANHNVEASSTDRGRIHAVHAAEAGLNRVIALIQKSRTEDLPCSVNGSTSGDLSASYTTTVQYYSTYPPSSTTEIACPMSSGNHPLAAVLLSVGRGTGPGNIERTMQSQVRLTPIIGAFNSAIFADASSATLDFGNSLTVGRNSTFDGDVYTNGNWHCGNSTVIEGSVYVQGTATMDNSCLVKGDLWANGTVIMQRSSVVRRDVASSTDNIDVSGANSKPVVEGHASAGKLCAGCATTSPKKVAGVITENNPIGPPPQKDFPKVVFKRDQWQANGWNVVDYDCASARTYIESSFASAVQKQVVRITARCDINFSNNITINMPHDLAIVTDGSITISQQTTFRSSNGTRREMFMLVPYYYHPDTEDDANKQECTPDPQGDISIGNKSNFENVVISVYTPCKVSFANNNTGNKGQIYGGEVAITNQAYLQYDPILIPGTGDVTGYEVDPAFIREIIG